ncbi:hypothetical protein [Melittangium boletus]|uniref:Uncharacterized protein n=1 Tax=Melittangium boletus DSM 14713 TaxID=1294270 RepID=A0A250IIM5_9BACT|nr:hypothetical protein [Melittangium boletus]ATB31021.1 hypothetical protein MEBOL_004483 [Melittangium boletus DSM 14713]
MGIPIHSNVPSSRWPPQQVAPRNEEHPRVAEQAAPPPPRPSVLPEHLRDSFIPSADDACPPVNDAAEAKTSQGFSSDAKTVAQPTETTCGKATAASIFGATDPCASNEQLLDNVERAAESSNRNEALREQVVVDLTEDTTAREMGVLMGQGGKEVVRGFGDYDTDAMDEAISKGQFGMALVDSSALPRPPGAKATSPDEKGSLHWITIDGVNKGKSAHAADDLYRVKDPVNGEYWLSKAQLEKAVNKAKHEQGTGGMLIVKNRPDVQTQEARDALALANLQHTDALGSDGGIGIRRGSSSESSYW